MSIERGGRAAEAGKREALSERRGRAAGEKEGNLLKDAVNE